MVGLNSISAVWLLCSKWRSFINDTHFLTIGNTTWPITELELLNWWYQQWTQHKLKFIYAHRCILWFSQREQGIMQHTQNSFQPVRHLLLSGVSKDLTVFRKTLFKKSDLCFLQSHTREYAFLVRAKWENIRSSTELGIFLLVCVWEVRDAGLLWHISHAVNWVKNVGKWYPQESILLEWLSIKPGVIT